MQTLRTQTANNSCQPLIRKKKYKRAADATWDAIQAALGAGHELYKANTTSNAYPEPTNLTERTLRMTFMDSENFKEVIFPEPVKQVLMVSNANPYLSSPVVRGMV